MVNIIGAICLLYIFSWLFVVIDNLIDDIIDKIKAFINIKIKKIKPINKSVNEMFNRLRNSKFREFYLNIYRFFLHIKESPDDTYYNIKYFIQRGRKGYSKRDIWSFDRHLSDIIINGLKDLKEIVHASPCGQIGVQAISIEENPENDKDLIKWKKILDNIIWTFEIAKKIRDHSWILVFDEKDRIELKKYERRLNTRTKTDNDLFEGLDLEDVETKKYHLMTKTEMQRYRKGWELFQNYYFDLWD